MTSQAPAMRERFDDEFEDRDFRPHTDLEKRNPVIDVEKNLIRAHIRDAYDGGRLVDIGGNWGEVISGIPPQTLESATVVDFAASRLRGGSGILPGVEYVCGDGTNLPLKDESASLVVCSEVIEHVEDAYSLLDELARILAPGGTLVMSGPADNPLKNATIDLIRWRSDSAQFRFDANEADADADIGSIFHTGFTDDQLEILLDERGLTVTHLDHTIRREAGVVGAYNRAHLASQLADIPLLRRIACGHFILRAENAE